MSWETLGQPAPDALVDARLQLHHAAQLAASAGKTLLDPQPDDSHPNLGWQAATRSLAGHPLEGGVQAAIQPDGLRLILLDAAGAELDGTALEGRTMADGSAWLATALERHAGASLPSGLTSPGYHLPTHAVASGTAFSADPAALAELGRWFSNAATALGEVARVTDGASDVRCWPHHFDLATLVAVETDGDGNATKTIGLGLSPGDDGYPEPYWYVTPWPYPDAAAELPALPPGAHWHREGYTAAILTASGHVAASDQAACLADFLDASLAASRIVHGG